MNTLIRDIMRDGWNALLFFTLCIFLSLYFIILQIRNNNLLLPSTNTKLNKNNKNVYLQPCTQNEDSILNHISSKNQKDKKILIKSLEDDNNALQGDYTR